MVNMAIEEAFHLQVAAHPHPLPRQPHHPPVPPPLTHQLTGLATSGTQSASQDPAKGLLLQATAPSLRRPSQHHLRELHLYYKRSFDCLIYLSLYLLHTSNVYFVLILFGWFVNQIPKAGQVILIQIFFHRRKHSSSKSSKKSHPSKKDHDKVRSHKTSRSPTRRKSSMSKKLLSPGRKRSPSPSSRKSHKISPGSSKRSKSKYMYINILCQLHYCL